MINIEWVLVRTVACVRAIEFEFAVSELRRQLPARAKWLFGDEAVQLQVGGSVDPSAVVLLLEHPWLTLERRCLERLCEALEQGYDVVEACDSLYPVPMAFGGYATLRGMERFVDAQPFGVAVPDSGADTRGALVRLTRVAELGRISSAATKVGRVSGAFAHDVSSYFGSDRAEVLALIPPSSHLFLDIGGGEGNFLRLVKTSRGGETHLVELDQDAANVALKNNGVDHVWSGDFLNYQSSLKFDCISFLDMLEHVVNADRYLAHARTLLSTNGVVLVSIPNVGHWSVIADLIEGRWDYVPAGIHCITHLRFFTEKTIRDLFDRADFDVERIERVLVPGPATWIETWHASSGLIADRASLDTYAFLVLGQPKTGSLDA